MSKQDFSRRVVEFVSPVQTIVAPTQTIEEALSTIREREIHEKIVYFYVVNEAGKLVGVVPTRRLLLRSPKTRIEEIMDKKVIGLLSTETLDQAMHVFETYHLLALPVVDEDQHFLGVVDVQLYMEETVDIVNARRRNDVFQMLGFYIEEGKRFTPWKSYRMRMPWIFCNMFGGFACAAISKFYEVVLSQVIVLAMFIPLVLALSESISMQSMTLSLQHVQRRHQSLSYLVKTLFRECKTLLLLSLTCSLTVGGISLLWGFGLAPGITITTGILSSIVITGAIGAAVPIILHLKEWDPKVAAGPIVLTCADIITTTIYLSVATWWLI
ncbi:MAG: magnesium transporter [Simkaniaceae bacterium]